MPDASREVPDGRGLHPLAKAPLVPSRPLSTRSHRSLAVSIVFIALLLWVARGGGKWALAVYGLSFWHYYVYWLAYRYGAVPLAEFQRDAVMLKSVSLLSIASVYLSAPLHWPSLAVIASGFLLNALAARVLGADRTYYGHELAGLPRLQVTEFPYSWISHPMLLGNIAAFGGTLLNASFRQSWWPLAAIHIAMNLGLLVMELAVTPLRPPASSHRTSAGSLVPTIGAALAGATLGATLGGDQGLVLGSCMAIYAFAMWLRYSSPERLPAHESP